MNVDNLGQAIEVLRHADVLVDDQLCVNGRARSMLCRACENACSASAITLGLDRVDVDEHACTGCGACVPACPAGTLQSTVFDPQRFLNALGTSTTVHVHCSESKDGGGGVVIPCHMLLDGRLAAAAMAAGVDEMVLHRRSECGDCRRGDATARLDATRADLERWFGNNAMILRDVRPGDTAGRGKAQHEDQIRASRRNFLRLAGAKAAASIAWLVPVAEFKPPVAVQGISVGAFKQQVVAYQRALAQQVASLPWQEDALMPWVGRSFADTCSACGVCADRCPTGALSRHFGQGVAGVAFTASVCTNCGLCSAICPEHSVRAAPSRSVAAVVSPRSLLVSRALTACDQCGQGFNAVAGETVCPQCGNEQAMDEDWLAMLA